MRQNIATPSSVRKHPETFCWTLIIRRSRSAWLLSKGTAKSSKNRSTAHFPQRGDPADCAQGFVWVALVRAWHVQTAWGLQEGDWPGTLLRGAHHTDEASVPAPAHPVRAGPTLWLAPPRLSCSARALSFSWPSL